MPLERPPEGQVEASVRAAGLEDPHEPAGAHRKRIFWLGMHQVLVQTELPRLRRLGYEVFNPPYLSAVQDQSAALAWTAPADSTLPPEVLSTLSRTNFFYASIPPQVGELLNAFFDVAIVTINPMWLKNFMAVFKGRVIYRTYGQPHSLSNELQNSRAISLISERDDFWFVPHTQKTLDIEDSWLIDRMRVVPYCITEDVVSLNDRWTFIENQGEMGMLCPRAGDNEYYNKNYVLLKNFFSDKNYKIFGSQIVRLDDPQVVGTLSREAFLSRMQALRGFVYHYDEPTVCYLPPLEFMTIGGPVVFKAGSLLSRYFDCSDAPGAARQMEDLVRVAARVQGGDRKLIGEIVDSQKTVRRLYHPDHVWPIFDATMNDLLGEGGRSVAPRFLYQPPVVSQRGPEQSAPVTDSRAFVLLPFHRFGPSIVRRGSNYHCAEGIARVARLAVRALADAGYTVVATSDYSTMGRVHGFLSHAIPGAAKIQILPVGDDPVDLIRGLWWRYSNLRHRLYPALSFLAKLIMAPYFIVVTILHGVGLTKAPDLGNKSLNIKQRLRARLVEAVVLSVRWLSQIVPSIKGDYVRTADKDNRFAATIIVHYYLFPETINTKLKLYLYLPDYLPHFYRGSVSMGDLPSWRRTGARLARKAERVFTNSRFTRSYLPETVLRVPAEKIVYFPLPDLNKTFDSDLQGVDQNLIDRLPSSFVFYPTRDRPSKRLADFCRAVAIVNRRLLAEGRSERLYGVLTTEVAAGLAEEDKNYIISLSDVSDRTLIEIYKHCTCVLFTSEMEGNFPTQINEALNLDVPVVATRIPLIADELGECAAALDLVGVGDCEGFADAVQGVMKDREAAIRRQRPARDFVVKNFSYEAFRNGLLEMLRL